MLLSHNTRSYFENHVGTKQPIMIFLLMGLNILVYALHVINQRGAPWSTLRDSLLVSTAPLGKLADATLENMALIPSDFYQAPGEEWKTLIGSMFTHANIAHLAFNMAALYRFGRPLEHAIGPGSVFLIYMVSGILTNLIYALGNRKSQVGIVGASAAISGIGAAYFLEYADQRNMKTWLMFQIAGALLAQGSGVSFVSHLIGFAVGAIVYLLLKFFKT
jgi:membrane associated rhomboid family serine protease